MKLLKYDQIYVTVNYTDKNKETEQKYRYKCNFHQLRSYNTFTVKIPNNIKNISSIDIEFGKILNTISIRNLSIRGGFKKYVPAIPQLRNFIPDKDFLTITPHAESIRITKKKNEQFTITLRGPMIDYFHYLKRYTSFRYFFNGFMITLFILLMVFLTIHASYDIRTTQYNNYYLFVIISFFIVILLPLSETKIELFNRKVTREKRQLTGKTNFNFQKLLDFPADFESYYNDNFMMRGNLIQFHSFIKTKLFKVSPMPSKVVLGKNDWFFYSGYHCMEDFRGIMEVPGEELEQIKTNYEARRRVFDSLGIKYYLFVPPNKHSVYPEYIPDTIKQVKNNNTRTDQILGYLKNNSRITIVDPTDELLRAKNDYDLYYKTDTHWNLVGATIGFNKLVNRIKQDFPQIHEPLSRNDFKITKYHLSNAYSRFLGNDNVEVGDLFSLVYINKDDFDDYFFDLEPKIPLPETKYIMELPSEEMNLSCYSICKTKAVNTNDLTVLVIRDSFFIIPLISGYFENCTFLWVELPSRQDSFPYEIIQEMKPDIIIEEHVERFMPLFYAADFDVDGIIKGIDRPHNKHVNNY